MHRRISLLIVAVAVLCLAVAVPTASAGKKTDRAQNKKLKSHSKSIKKNSGAIKKNSQRIRIGEADVGKLKSAAKDAADAIQALKGIADRADTNAATVLAAAPAIIKGLNDLKDGLVAAGGGLTSLQQLATSQEYGIGQVIVAEPTPNPQEGSFIETPDIPDTVQQGMTTQQFVAQQTGALVVAYGVRSNETDGTGAATAAAAAAACKVTVTNEGGTTETTAPNATLGGVPFQFVPTKSTLTSTVPANAGFPFGLKTVAPDADNTVTFATAVTVTLGDTYTVGMSCVDTSPSATDPSA